MNITRDGGEEKNRASRNRQGDNWKEIFPNGGEDGGAFSLTIHHELHPDDQKALDAREGAKVVSNQ